jgi:hypothetical protein
VTRRAGSGLVEALVAVALVSVVAGATAAAAVCGGRALVLVRRDAAATALGVARLDALRAGPRADGADAPAGSDGTTFARQWRVTPGRGRPDLLDVTLDWPGHRLDLATAVLP